MTLLLDADSMIYIIAWNNREDSNDDLVRSSCDSFFRDIFTYSQADDYIGVFSDDKSFRNDVYKFAPYKGNRGEKPECVIQYAPVIKQYFLEKYGFITVPEYEADDVIVSLAVGMKENCIIASPDKDLRQIPGRFIDYGKPEFMVVEVDEVKSNYSFWLQMLTGDSTDNVAGVPGLGEVKGKKILDECMDPMQYENSVKLAYNKYFGNYYGPTIYRDTYITLKMVQPGHFMYRELEPLLQHVKPQIFKKPESIFDV